MRLWTTIVLLMMVGLAGFLVMAMQLGRLSQREAPPSERRLFEPALRPEQVVGVEIRLADEPPVVLVRRDDGWHMDRPATGAARTRQVDSVLQMLAELQVTREIGQDDTDRPGPKRHGLDAPGVEVELTDTDGRTRTLRVGKAHPLGALTYVQWAGDDTICLVRGRPEGLLRRLADDCRDLAARDNDAADASP